LHPLESAALSRRTHDAAIECGDRGGRPRPLTVAGEGRLPDWLKVFAAILDPRSRRPLAIRGAVENCHHRDGTAPARERVERHVSLLANLSTGPLRAELAPAIT